MKKIILMSLIIGLCAGQSFASYFFDDFESDGGWKLEKTDFKYWDVTAGTSVDLIGVGSSWNYFPSYGHYVDMVGYGDIGTITTKDSFLFSDGATYTLSFDLAGSQRGTKDDEVVVNVGTLFSETYSFASTDPFTHITEIFTVGEGQGGYYSLSFTGNGGGNIGMLLDNVSLVPVPATILLGFIGLGVGGWKLRKSMK